MFLITVLDGGEGLFWSKTTKGEWNYSLDYD